jgi:hypothetical protein
MIVAAQTLQSGVLKMPQSEAVTEQASRVSQSDRVISRSPWIKERNATTKQKAVADPV